MGSSKQQHISVLLEESINALHVKKGGVYIDATLGAGGHTIEIINRGGKVLGIDQDSKMLEVAKKNIESACPPRKSSSFVAGSFTLEKANFKDIDQVAAKLGYTHVDGVLMDLGVSSMHLDSIERGFSFNKPSEKLDMRLDENLGVTAADLLNSLDRNSLVDLFATGESNREAYLLAKKVIEYRSKKPFDKVSDFLTLFGNKIPGRNHPATKAMMALRIAVNTELQVLEEALPKAFNLLNMAGRLVVISFHSGEDRIVKKYFSYLEKQNLAKVLSKKPIEPTEAEIETNPRSRSAKLRFIEKNEVYKPEKSNKNKQAR